MDFWLFLFSKDTEFAHALVTVIGSSYVVHGLSDQNCLSLLHLLNSCSKRQIFVMSENVISASQLKKLSQREYGEPPSPIITAFLVHADLG